MNRSAAREMRNLPLYAGETGLRVGSKRGVPCACQRDYDQGAGLLHARLQHAGGG